MKAFEGNLLAKGLKFGIVVSRFNELITKRLLDGSLDALKRHGAEEDDIEIAWTPGCFEMPIVARKMAQLGKYDGMVCLGAVIRGDTPHFEYVAAEVAKGIAKINYEGMTPAAFGVITADSLDQAIERAGSKSGNKGWQAAMSAIEMANLLKTIS